MSTEPHAIVRTTTRLIRIPVDPPRGDAIQKFDALELPMVWITDRAGRTGTGFGYTIGKGGTTILELLRTELLDWLEGKDSSRISFIHDHLYKSIHALTPGPVASNALAAIDVALWDLAGKRAEAPLHNLLGGAKERVLVYNTHVGWLDHPLDEMVELCLQAVNKDGFRALKLKVGKEDPDEDCQRIARVREAVGPKVRLMIDANQSWTIDEAVPRLRSLARYDLYWIEEPLPATDIEGYYKLSKQTSICLAGGESLYSLGDFYHYVRRRALDILQPDIARIAGITNAMKVCHLGECANLKVAPHVSPELSVTIAAAVSNSVMIEYVPQMEPILKRRIRIEQGYAFPSNSPGHGIEFDNEALARYEVKV
jgi:L-alanine-DL-glutamate epimerase-like enolase superfamily enzyme